MKKSIKTDIYSFAHLREGNHLYVDKTRYVWELVKDMGCYFLSRPRRFGKSLLLSTFEAYFKGRKELFKGLEIERLAPDVWEAYPVIRLDMTFCSAEQFSCGEIREKLLGMLSACAEQHGVEAQGTSPGERLSSLVVALSRARGKPVVILVDEYDKPILEHILKDDVHDVLAVLKEFYQVIKAQNEIERFVFVTGVTKFAHTSLFAGFNNLTDLTLRGEYATILGYTEEELRANFAEHITETARTIGMDEEEMLARMKRRYDGFRFANKAPTVYNPVSVGKFFCGRGEFCNYWTDTGTPTFFFKAAQHIPMTVIEQYRGRYVERYSFDKYEVDRLDPFLFAVQTGYLTIADTRIDDETTLYKMDFPNKEIRETFSQFLLRAYTGHDEGAWRMTMLELRRLLRDGDLDGFFSRLQSALSGLSWGNLGKVDGNEPLFYEGYFRNILTFLFLLINIDNEPETRTANGQIDLVARAGAHRYVFELKCGAVGGEGLPQISQMTQIEGESFPQISQMTQIEGDGELREMKIGALLDAAMEQARRKGYWEKYLNYPHDIQMIALAFDTDTRTLAGWRVERIR